MNQLISGDSVAFQRQVAALSKTRLKLQVSAGVLIAIVSASHVLSGIMDGDLGSKRPFAVRAGGRPLYRSALFGAAEGQKRPEHLRLPAPAHVLFGKPVPTFPGHAPGLTHTTGERPPSTLVAVPVM